MKFRKILTAEAEKSPDVIVWTWNCQLHEAHLIVKSGLVLADSALLKVTGSKYFSLLAKVVNIWRDAPHSFFTIWKEAFGPACAVQFARGLPPRCLSGRWGSIAGTESWLLRCDFKIIQEVFKRFLLKHSKTDKASKPRAAGHPDEPSQDEIADHIAKLTRWRKDVHDGVVIHGEHFARLVQVMHDAHAPLMHFLFFIEKAQAQHDLVFRDGAGVEHDFETYGPLAKIACKACPELNSSCVCPYHVASLV
jgi:hypothetical protein